MQILKCSLWSISVLLASSGLIAQTSDEVESLDALYQRDRQNAIARATKPLDEAYVSKLQEIKARLTKAGRLDEALQVETILDTIELQQKVPGEWKWGDSGNRFLSLSDDHTAILSGDEEEAAWIVLGPRKIRLFFVHTSYVITFDAEMKTGKAERRDGVKAVLRRAD